MLQYLADLLIDGFCLIQQPYDLSQPNLPSELCNARQIDRRLIDAAKANSVDEARKLINLGANPNATDEHGASALYSLTR